MQLLVDADNVGLSLLYNKGEKKLIQSPWISFVLESQANEIIESMFFYP